VVIVSSSLFSLVQIRQLCAFKVLRSFLMHERSSCNEMDSSGDVFFVGEVGPWFRSFFVVSVGFIEVYGIPVFRYSRFVAGTFTLSIRWSRCANPQSPRLHENLFLVLIGQCLIASEVNICILCMIMKNRLPYSGIDLV